MSYQYDQTNTYYTYNHTVDGTSFAPSIGIEDAASSTPSGLGSVGDILTGTILQGGASPVVEMNGTPIQVRSDALKDRNAGEQIYLRITENSASEITMKLIDPSTFSVSGHNGILQTTIRQNTTRFVENWKQQNPDSEDGVLAQDAEQVLSSLSPEEKAKLRQMGLEVTSSNLTVIKGLLSQFRGNEHKQQLQAAIEDIRHQIQLSDPQIKEVTEQAMASLPITEEQTVYMIQNNQSLRLDQLYQSKHSMSTLPAHQPISDSAYREMLPQINRAIQAAGLPVSETSQNAARFLLDHQLPVNTDSLKLYEAIRDVNAHGFSAQTIWEHFTADLAVQDTPTISDSAADAVARHTELYFSTADKIADQIQQDLHILSDANLDTFAQSGLPYTLENLSLFFRFRTDASANTNSTNDTASTAGTVLSAGAPGSVQEQKHREQIAYRQLEELRLKMTWEASYTLASEDIHLRARDLSQLVEKLRSQEQDFYKQQLQAQDGIVSTTVLKQLQDADRKITELPDLPAAALGSTLFSGSLTINRLYEQGVQIRDTMQVPTSPASSRVSEYETLMTRPRSDMGDSIRKAFQNVDAILDDLELPVTADNQRAVRILGYNQMNITGEQIAQVKVADQEVQELLQTIQPSTVLHLVQDGVDLLNMPFRDLNALIREYSTDAGTAEEESYSEFLLKLERRHRISSEERESYIGVYRLLDKISKSGEQDLGSLLRNGQSLTLQNLLTSHRSNRAVGVDTTIDPTFGGLEVTGSATSIDTQILSARYNRRLATQLLQHLSPDTIDSMVEEAANGTTLEEFYDTIQEQLTEAPTEAFVSASDPAFTDMDTWLQQFDILPSITNLVMASDIRRGGSRTFRLIEEQVNQISGTEEQPSVAEEMNQLDSHLTSPDAMEQTYMDLEQTITDALHSETTATHITARDIQALKQIRAGLRIMQKMSRKEQFQIPFSVNGEWNIMNLSILSSTDGTQNPQIQADVTTHDQHHIHADLRWDADHWNGTLSTDDAGKQTILEQSEQTFSELLEHLSASYTADEIPSMEDLYRTARQFVGFLRQI